MTHLFLHPTDRQQIAARADVVALEAEAMRDMADALGRFEDATGRKLLVSDAGFATTGAEARWLADSAVGVYDQDMPASPTGVEIENAAQAHCDGGPAVVQPADAPQAAQGARTAAETRNPAPAASTTPLRAGLGRASYAKAGTKSRTAKADDRPWGKLTLPERQIVKHLERLPDTLTPAEDLRLVEMLTGGWKIGAAAEAIEISHDAALARWRLFMSEDVIGADGRPTLDGQQRLLNALRYRVEQGDE